MGLPARDGPRAGTRIVGCSPDKPMLLISSSHEKQTAIKLRASRDREFLVPARTSGPEQPLHCHSSAILRGTETVGALTRALFILLRSPLV